MRRAFRLRLVAVAGWTLLCCFDFFLLGSMDELLVGSGQALDLPPEAMNAGLGMVGLIQRFGVTFIVTVWAGGTAILLLAGRRAARGVGRRAARG